MVNICGMSGATNMQGGASGYLYGFEKDMSERGTFKSIIFYLLTGRPGVIEGDIMGRGSTHLVSYFPLHAHG